MLSFFGDGAPERLDKVTATLSRVAQSHPDSHQPRPITVPSWLTAVNPQLYSSTTSTMAMDGCTVTVPKVTRLPAAAGAPPHPHPHPLMCSLSDLVQVHIAHNPAVLHRSRSRSANCVCSGSVAARRRPKVCTQTCSRVQRAHEHANRSVHNVRSCDSAQRNSPALATESGDEKGRLVSDS